MKGAEAAPRLLAVAPVNVEKEKLEGVKLPLILWTRVSLDETAAVTKVNFDRVEQERFRPEVEASLRLWRFAPARKDNQAIAAEVVVPFMIWGPEKAEPKSKIQPKAKVLPPPMYPLEMRRRGVNGEVVVSYVVDENGDVQNVKVVRSSNAAFEQAAVDCVKKWKYEPGQEDGKVVKTRMAIPIVFNLNQRGSYASAEVEKVSAAKQEKWPEELRHEVPPKPKKTALPVYPYELLREKVTVRAKVKYLVNEEGRVVRVALVEASHPEFGEALIAAVSAFEFIPSVKDEGKAGLSLLMQEQEFNPNRLETIMPERETDLDLLRWAEKNPDKIVPLQKLDTAVKPVQRAGPVGPLNAEGEGSAVVEVLVDKSGRARLPRIIEASGPAFGFAAADAARFWRFEVPKSDGKPVVLKVRIPFKFKGPDQRAAGNDGQTPAVAPAASPPPTG